MIKKLSTIENLQSFQRLFESFLNKSSLNESIEDDYDNLLELMTSLFPKQNHNGFSYGSYHVKNLARIISVWNVSVKDVIDQITEHGYDFKDITIGGIEYTVYDVFWNNYISSNNLEDRYGYDSGYYSDEYGLSEEGQWVEYNTDLYSDGTIQFNVITDPVNAIKESVESIDDFEEAINKRISWEESNYDGDWDEDND